MRRIKKCSLCNRYTMKDRCPSCGGETRIAHPPKFSIEDKYAKYRRMIKFEVGELK